MVEGRQVCIGHGCEGCKVDTRIVKSESKPTQPPVLIFTLKEVEPEIMSKHPNLEVCQTQDSIVFTVRLMTNR